jgi:linoleoyl-CoA desaturase
MNKVTFGRQANFFNELKNTVDQYFKENNIRSTGNAQLYFKAIFLISSALALYIVLVFFTPSSPWVGILLSGLLGFVLAGIGFNIMHDACHGSFSSKKWVNDTLGLSMYALGSADFIWKLKHNVIHHTYTNVDGIDDDIAKEPLIRHCATQRKRSFHKYQHIYILPLYTITTLYWVFYTDFQKYFGRKVHNTPFRQISGRDHFLFWLSKVLYIFFYIALPIIMVGWGKFLAGFFVMHAVTGFTIAIVFQLAHVVEDIHFDEAIDKSKKIEQEWAVFQVNTTANFATDNKAITWFLGGLNFQVEHHLFPRVSHVHYPAINKLVIQTCRKFDIKYNAFPTMGRAVVSHLKVMKQLGA